MKNWKTFALSLFLIAPFCTLPAQAATSWETSPRVEVAAPVMSQCDFRLEVRKIFQDHIGWGRLTLVSRLNKLPDKDVNLQRLLKTGQDLADVFARYYGAQAGKQLADLFASHADLAMKVVDAAHAGDLNTLNIAKQQWIANADAIAHAFVRLNPQNWSETDLKNMLRQHLSLESNWVNDYLKAKYSDSVTDHELSLQHALKMADAISAGIILQFPDLFSK